MSRNVLCPHYKDCLDRAVATISDFQCDQCNFRQTIENIPFHEMEGCWLLLWRLFRPELYQEWVEYQRLTNGDIRKPAF